MGLGFLALVLGVFLFGGRGIELAPRLESLGWPWFAATVLALLDRLWVVAVLPGLAYGASRAFDLRPWSTAIGAAVTGEFFLLALFAITPGLGALWAMPLVLAFRLLSLAGGVALTALAVKKGRAAALASERRAQEAAAAKKAEYDAFVQESERVAERASSDAAAKDSQRSTG